MCAGPWFSLAKGADGNRNDKRDEKRGLVGKTGRRRHARARRNGCTGTRHEFGVAP